ncbi:ankyrin repeat-containing domain protein [Lactarius pseudohatsudake]|nr:ankyrin repeat-containing domain protein [Lactarius pseudohatsudake]
MFSPSRPDGLGSPLYYAAFCGFYDLAERLIMEHPEQVIASGGRLLAPLPAALHKRYFGIANLLLQHGADVDVRGDYNKTSLYAASSDGSIDIMRWLLDHGANVHAWCGSHPDHMAFTSLHVAAGNKQLEAVQVLLEHNADVNLRTDEGETPLHCAVSYLNHPYPRVVDVVERLLEHGADPNACGHNHSTPLSTLLHRVLSHSHKWLEVARLLLSYGANVDEKDRIPFQVASSNGHYEMTKLLLEHGAVAQPLVSVTDT